MGPAGRTRGRGHHPCPTRLAAPARVPLPRGRDGLAGRDGPPGRGTTPRRIRLRPPERVPLRHGETRSARGSWPTHDPPDASVEMGAPARAEVPELAEDRRGAAAGARGP